MNRNLAVLLLVVLSVIMVQGGDRFRFQPFGSVSGNNRRNFHANVGGRAEYDLHRFPSGAKVVGHMQGSQSFGRFDGQHYKGKPQGEVGVRLEVPIGRK